MLSSLFKVVCLTLLTPFFSVRSSDSSQMYNELSTECTLQKKSKVGTVGYVPFLGDNSYSDYQDYLTYDLSYISYKGDFLYGIPFRNTGEYLQFDNLVLRRSSNALTIRLYNSTLSDSLYFFDSDSISAYKYSQAIYVKGDFTDIDVNNSGSTKQQALNFFNNHFNSSYVSFKFDNQINYNAPFNETIYSSFFSASSPTFNLYQCVFLSNNTFYDNLILYLDDARGKTFLVAEEDPNSVYRYGYYTVPNSYQAFDYIYYDHMLYDRPLVYSYHDSLLFTSDTVEVNKRNQNYIDLEGTMTQFYDNSSAWLDSSFQELRIYNMAPSQFETLKSFNTSEFIINYEYIQNTGINYIKDTDLITPDVSTGFWLKDSFNLINLGITGLIGFLNIKVFPDLTIGAFILVPFAVSLLIIVLKLFKR